MTSFGIEVVEFPLNYPQFKTEQGQIMPVLIYVSFISDLK